PNFWINPQNRVNYRVAVQTPEHRIHSVDTLMSTPIIQGQAASTITAQGGQAKGTSAQSTQLLGNLAVLSRGTQAANINHYNVQPAYDVYANVQGRDLGAV